MSENELEKQSVHQFSERDAPCKMYMESFLYLIFSTLDMSLSEDGRVSEITSGSWLLGGDSDSSQLASTREGVRNLEQKELMSC